MKILKPYEDAFKFSISYQLPIGILTLMTLDGGQLFRYWAVAFTAYTVSAIMIMLRKAQAPNKTDLTYLKFGSLIILIITPIIMGIVWRIKGINY